MSRLFNPFNAIARSSNSSSISHSAYSRVVSQARAFSQSASSTSAVPTTSSSSSSSPTLSTPTTSTQPAPVSPYSLESPFTLHPPTHGYHVATLHLRSYGPELSHLEFFSSFALRVASSLEIPTSGIASLPTRVSLWTVPKGPFVHKKSQENFQRRTHKRVIKVWDADQQVLDRWLTFLRIHAMEGISMRVELFSYHPVDYSTKMLEHAQSQRRSSPPVELTSSAASAEAEETKSEESSTTAAATSDVVSENHPDVTPTSPSQAKMKELAEGILKDEMKDIGKEQ